MNTKELEILGNIIAGVESGDQQYGKKDYGLITDPYTNSELEDTITLGWPQFYGNEAKELLKLILKADPSNFRKLDTEGKIESTFAQDWEATKWNPSKTERSIIRKLIKTSVGKECQDILFNKIVDEYIAKCNSKYTSDVGATIMYVEIRHLGGGAAVNRIFGRLNKDYSIEAILKSLLADQGDDTSSNQVGDLKYWSRHTTCAEWIKKYLPNRERSRSKIVALAESWLGKNEADGSHRFIIDIYNSQASLPRGYRVTYNDKWCATMISALAVWLKYTDIIPPECGCEEQIKLFKQIGCWKENDDYEAAPGDIVYYDWQDSGAGDNVGYSDHVGIVKKREKRKMYVIEGNKNNKVDIRVINVGDRYIRGYGVPKYTDDAPNTSDAKTSTLSTNAKWTGTTTACLNVRKWAGTRYSKCSFSPLKKGTNVSICDTIFSASGNLWYYIKYNSRYGFVSGKYIKVNK